MAQIVVDEGKVESSSMKKTMDRNKRNSFCSSNRSVTDKYWSILFFFIFTIWLTSCYYAHYHYKPRSANNSNNNTATNETSKIVPFYLWGKHWVFDAITFNLTFLTTHYETSGLIVIGTNVLLSVLLIIYSLSSTRNCNLFHNQLETACYIFATIVFYNRSLVLSMSCNEKLAEFLRESNGKLYFWLFPELIFIIVCYAQKAHKNDRLEHYYDGLYYFRLFLVIRTLCTMIPIIIYSYLVMATVYIVEEIGWDCSLSYVIIGGSCYVGLTIFYVWLIAVSIMVDVDMDFNDDYINFMTPIITTIRPFVITCRYHFGTACYHATLIFPRLETFFVMNEPEFKEEERLAKFTARFRIAQSEVHNISLMSTAVGGTSHADSVRELLRHYATHYAPNLHRFQGFSQIARSSSALLLATNNLMLIWLWTRGLDDPSLSLATWFFYLSIIISFGMAMKISDVISDTTLLHLEWAAFDNDDLLYWSLFGANAAPFNS